MNFMTEKSRQDLENLVGQIMEDCHARGIALGVTDAAGTILYERYFGWRDAERKLPIHRDTIFGMASVTKSFTALSVMQMQQCGMLNVDDPVKDYIPEFTNKNQKEPVRIRHLLCHSGGYFPLPRIVVDETAREMGIEDSRERELIYRNDFADEGIRRVAGRLDSQTRFTGKPGQRMSYCNDGFGLLSDIVRRHSDCSSFADYLDRHILKPLDMERSNISFIRNTLDDNAAVLYTRTRDGGWRADRDFQNDAFVLQGGGGLKSTLGDMLKYAAMYLNEGEGINGKRIIDRYSIEEMCKPRQIVKPGVYYGYGLEIRQMGDMTVVEHGGSLPGVSSNFCFCPQAELGVVVLCNTMDVPVHAIAEAALRLYCGLPMKEVVTHSLRRWTENEKQQLKGEYVSGEGDRFLLTEETDGSLAMTVNGEPVDLLPVYPWQGIVKKKYSDVYMTAVRNEEGQVFGARYGSRIFPKIG
ncbi:MAG: beta-lactamase family protein [Clostridiales bacterium]|nr:beta-lactamase family protein [Clostridiales bacterium]